MGSPKPINVPRLDAGLNSKDPVTSLAPGVLQTADNVRLDGRLLSSAPGFERVTNAAPRDHTMRLNGVDQHFRARVTANDTLATLDNDGWSLECFFRIDAMPRDIASAGNAPTMAVFYKGDGLLDKGVIVASGIEYGLFIEGRDSSGALRAVFVVDDDAGGVAAAYSTTELTLHTWYHFAATQSTIANPYRIYIHEVGTAIPSSEGTTASGGPSAGSGDLWIGGVGRTDAVKSEQAITYPFKGVVQELRIWDVERSSAELGEYDTAQLTSAQVTAETELVYYQRMTGSPTNSYFYEDVTSATSGSGSGQAPYIRFQPRDVTWLVTNHIIATTPMLNGVGIDLDGELQGLVVPNAYLYRKQAPSADGELPFHDYFAVSFRCKIKAALKDRATIFQYVPVSDDDWVTNLLTDKTANGTVTEASVSNVLIEVIDTGTNNYRFRAVVEHYAVSAGTHQHSSVVSGTNISAGTEYTVTVGIDTVNESVKIWVNNQAVQTTDWTASYADEIPFSTPDDPTGMNRRYHMSIGRAVKRTRQLLDAGSDPNGSEIEYQMDRTFNGELRQMVIATPSSTWQFQYLHKLVQNEEITRKSSTQVGLQMVAVWGMGEGAGGSIGDTGLQQNAIAFQDDPKHVWGYSGITTNAKAAIKGLFNHRYRAATGEQKKFIAIAGGTVYEVDLANNELDYIVDGLRNDKGNQVSGARYLDSLILCTGHGGSGNHQLQQTELYSLGIDPPTGIIPFGLSDQLNDDASLEKGTYRAGFAYYSAHLNKWSPMGPTLEIEIKSPRANLAYGSDAEINQTHARTGFGTDYVAGGTYDIYANNAVYSCFKVWSWYGAQVTVASSDPDWWESGPGASAGPKKTRPTRIWFNKGKRQQTHASIEDEEFATPESLIDVSVALSPVRWFFEKDTAERLQMTSVFVGSNAYLAAGETSPPGDPLGINGSANIDMISKDGRFGWGPGDSSTFPNTASGGGADPWQGTGDSSHGLVLPKSNDPQVTHLGYFRSVNGGQQLRLVRLLPNGTEGFADYTEDASNTGEIFDELADTPESTEFVTEYGGRMLFVKDSQQPQRAYFSEINKPWNVPAQNVVDFLDGNSLAITGVARTEGSVAIFKDDTTFVLSPPTNPLVPFTIETRTVDIGCVAPFSIVNVHENLFYPSEKGFYQFDMSFPRYLSEIIEPTWQAVSIANRGLIVGVHDRRNKTILWGVPSGSTKDASGNVINDQMITWDYSVGADIGGRRMGWAKRTNLSMSVAAIVPDVNEINRVYFADGLGYIYLHDSGTNFGVGTRTSSRAALAVTDGGASSITVPQVSDLTSSGLPEGYRGLFVTHITAAGVRETRLCIADDLASPSVLTLDHAWTTSPVNSDTADVGSIEFLVKFGELTPAGMSVVTEWVETFVRQATQSTQGTVTLTYEAKAGVTQPGSGTQTFLNDSQESMRIGFNPAVRGASLILGFHAKGPDIPVQLRDLLYVIRSIGDHEYQVMT